MLRVNFETSRKSMTKPKSQKRQIFNLQNTIHGTGYVYSTTCTCTTTPHELRSCCCCLCTNRTGHYQALNHADCQQSFTKCQGQFYRARVGNIPRNIYHILNGISLNHGQRDQLINKSKKQRKTKGSHR